MLLLCCALLLALGCIAARAQVTPSFSIEYPFGFQAEYYRGTNFGEFIFSQTEPHVSINGPLNIFLPADPRIPTNNFSARWSGRILPLYSGSYTFHVSGADGFRLWLDGQLVVNRWFDQASNEFSAGPFTLTAGVPVDIKAEHYEKGNAVPCKLLWTNPCENHWAVRSAGNDPSGLFASYSARFGSKLQSLGNGRFVASSPTANIALSNDFSFTTKGCAWIFDQDGQPAGFARAPLNSDRSSFGTSLAAFSDGRFMVSGRQGTNALIYMHDSEGSLLRSWQAQPDQDPQLSFGTSLAAANNWFAVSATGTNGKVFVYAADQVGAPMAAISNPTPTPGGDLFGANVVALGQDRLIVSDTFTSAGVTKFGVHIFRTNGAPLRFIPSPNPYDWFGLSILPLDDHRFLVGAAYADVVTFANNQFVTNAAAGIVYLYDDTGALLRTFTPANPANSRYFGLSLARLGTERIVIGAPEDKVNGVKVGRVHLYNLSGAFLTSIDNPTPSPSAAFGSRMIALDDSRLIIADDRASTPYGKSAAGAVYGYDLPVPMIELGTEVARPAGVDASPVFLAQGPTVAPAGAAFWHAGSGKLFAAKPGQVQVDWPLIGGGISSWQGLFVWPTNSSRYQLHVGGLGVVSLAASNAFTNTLLLATSTDVDADLVSDARKFSATLPGDSFILFSAGHPSTNAIAFQFVRTVHWNDPAYLHDNVPATIGLPVSDPAGYLDPAAGNPQVVQPGSVFCPAPVYDPVTRAGTIIPVNRDKENTDTDDLVVAYLQRGTRLFNPISGTLVSNAVCWPAKPVRYRPEWPANPPKIIIASQQGTGVIDPAQHVDWQLYFQNDPAQPGFNPNDEHALRRSVQGGDAVFPLRSDLGTTNTSESYVMIRYRDPAAGLQWRMKLWRVVAEEAPHFFQFNAQAGALLSTPYPLATLASMPQTMGVSGPFWRDRKRDFWARAGGNDGGAAEIVIRYFYPMQPEFFVPGTNAPAVGSAVPWLDLFAGTPGTPLNMKFTATWPSTVPELRVGETLVKPKNGLPQIAGQTSVDIIYDQSSAQDSGSNARLIDPTRIRSVPLALLPAGIQTQNRSGMLHFPALPPHLEKRVSYDNVLHRLRLKGEFVEPPSGESYLLLNVLAARDKAALLELSTDSAFRAAVEALSIEAAAPIDILPGATAFDSLALSAGQATGNGYVTLAFGNNTNLNAPGNPVSLGVIRVTCPLYKGEVKVLKHSNPLAELLSMRHSGDFGGRPGDYEFEWRTLPPDSGFPSSAPPEQWTRFTTSPASGMGAMDIQLAGPGLYTLSDNYFICRYRRISGAAPCGSDWSDWTPPMLAEGWVKRVLAGINPFEQRVQDYQNTQVNTVVSMISQAGARAVGDVAINPDAVNNAGLIEVYETILRRALALSIEGVPAINYGPANDALLLAAGRLADLYTLLGNEAYADAADPTIAFGTDDGVYGSQATSIHCFMNQSASLLEEELGLLRGRDATKLPSVKTFPFYNRLIWNFTRDITGGEVAYALNYNIRNVDGDVAGQINEADARRLYPQGHGDAWGHYLIAIKNYYRLLRNTNFTWVPRVEGVVVGGSPVSVDFLDERKFAGVAAARAKTGAEVVNLTFRSSYVENAARAWQTTQDAVPGRAWSMADWATRSGQGALFDWVAANALLPDVDNDPTHTGIQKIDRTTVRELTEIAEAFRRIQEQVDEADSGRNPLGLARNVVPFDIDPSAISSGKTHFDQVNERANEALKNAVAVFDHANGSSQLLRRQADDASEFQQRVVDAEADYKNRLIEIFGTPYTDDIGPTGTYPSGYTGPDMYHYDYTDDPELRTGVSNAQSVLTINISDVDVSYDGVLSHSTQPVKFHISANGFGLEKPAAWTGQRVAPGEIQQARAALIETLRRLERGAAEYENLIDHIEDSASALQAEFQLNATQLAIREWQTGSATSLDEKIRQLRRRANATRHTAQAGNNAAMLIAEALPKVVGLATDAFSVKAAILRFLGRSALLAMESSADGNEEAAAELQDEKNRQAALTDLQIISMQADFQSLERLRALEQLIRSEFPARLELAALEQAMQQAMGRYQAAVARGLRLLEERTRFRQQTAAQVQQYRHRDMAFRIFRSDALQKYRAQFDLAARYAYLAAKAYDFETCLAPGDSRGPGAAFLGSIVRSRSLGRFSNGVPLPGNNTGDPGLADPLARMTANWNLVLKSQLGFNNPQTETGRFSMRNELFRVVNGPNGSQRWRETLSSLVVPNLLDIPEFQRHCIPFSPTQPVEPGIVIPFATTVNFGLNFFGWPAGGGDNDYDSTKFATRVRSVGVWFANYNNLGGGMINTPRVYLVPVGLDVTRAPSQGDAFIREWRVVDQALPVPFPLSSGSLNDPSYIPANDSLSEEFASIRRFGRFRAYHDSGNFNAAETISDSRLIGRSVWNTRWLLIIPAGTLHTDRNEGLQRFINGALKTDGSRDGNGVSDIKVFFQTYAYSGN